MDNILKLQNDYSWLISEDLDLINKLHRSLRVPAKNYWHNPRYKKKLWDGHVEFFKKSGMFLSGLLPEVMAALRVFNKPFTTVDERTKIDWLYKPEQIDQNFLNPWKPKDSKLQELHDYQPDYVRMIMKHNRGLIKAPTAAGKTFILIAALKCLPPKTPVLFLTKDASLVAQNYDAMKAWGVPDLGRFYGKYKEPNYVVCSTTASLPNIAKLLPSFKALFVDEVHLCVSKVPKAAYRRMKKCGVRIGFSATPFKYNEKDKEQKYDTKGYFGPLLKTTTTETGFITTGELQKRNILDKSKGTFINVYEPKNIQHEPYQDAVTLGIAQNIYFLNNIIKPLALSRKGRTVILVERIVQGEYLKQLIPSAHWLSGRDSVEDRKPVFEELRTKKKVICICMRHIITAGIDVFLHDLINASGQQAEHNIIQLIGRGLRKADDKDGLRYWDFIFKTNDYIFDHSMNRLNTLQNEGHEITVVDSVDEAINV